MLKRLLNTFFAVVLVAGMSLLSAKAAYSCDGCSLDEKANNTCEEFDFNDDGKFDWVLRLINNPAPDESGETEYQYKLEQRSGPCLDVLSKIVQIGELTNDYDSLNPSGNPVDPIYVSTDVGYRLAWNLLSEPEYSSSACYECPCISQLYFSVTIKQLFSPVKTKIKLRTGEGVIGVGFILGPGDYESSLNNINNVKLTFLNNTVSCNIVRDGDKETLICPSELGFAPVLPEAFKISGKTSDGTLYECTPSDIDINGNALIFTCKGSCNVLVRVGGRTYWRTLPDAYCP